MARNIPAADLHLLASATNLVARNDLHPMVVGLLLQAAREIHRPASLLAEEGTFPSPRYTSLPLSSAAVTYLDHGRGLIYRLLPFWLAGLLTWLVQLLTPAATVALFLFRILPGWRRLRFNLRVRRFFKRLVRLEKARGAGVPSDEILRDLDQLDRDSVGLKVPRGMASPDFEFRQAIHDMRDRLKRADAPADTSTAPGVVARGRRPAAASHPKTDVVTLDSGDTFHGEIKKVTTGTLTLKTASVGTLSVKWSHVARLVSTFQYQVQVTSGERYFGSLAEPDKEGHLKIVGSGGTHSLPLAEVFWLGPIERGFWRKLTGSVNFGFSYTQSNQAVQYSLSADSQYLGPQAQRRRAAECIFSTQENADSASNQSLTLTVWRPLNADDGRAILSGVGQVQSNPNQGFDRPVARRRRRRPVPPPDERGLHPPERGSDRRPGAGDGVHGRQHRRPVSLGLRYSRYRTDFPKHSVNLIANTFTYLTQSSRFRAQISFKVSFEIIHNLNVSLNILDSYDSRPSTDDAAKNDLSITSSLGYTF